MQGKSLRSLYVQALERSGAPWVRAAPWWTPAQPRDRRDRTL